MGQQGGGYDVDLNPRPCLSPGWFVACAGYIGAAFGQGLASQVAAFVSSGGVSLALQLKLFQLPGQRGTGRVYPCINHIQIRLLSCTL